MTITAPAATRRPVELLAIVPIFAVVAAYVGFGLLTASTTLGCDYQAYDGAARHWLAGQPIYDLTVSSTGSCGTFQYPPPFVLVATPFSLIGFDAGNAAWIAFLLACWLLGTAILPVRVMTRWTVLLLGAVGWPLIFGVRIGQVTPILYLLFAWAWRSLERPASLGAAIALGTLVKLQPALLGLWLVVRRDWRALGAAIVVGLAVVTVAAVVGLRDWIGFATLLRQLTDALTVPANVAVGARFAGEGVDLRIAGLIQAINTAAIIGLLVVAGLRLSRAASFLVAVVASQLISPIVWTHYELVLMLPVAWLLDRRQWWIAIVPIAEAWVLLPFLPIWVDTIAFYAVLAALLAVGVREMRPERPTPATSVSVPTP